MGVEVLVMEDVIVLVVTLALFAVLAAVLHVVERW